MSEADKVKRPASQYYWGDWFKDLALQSCGLPARGLWHEMNCLMHQGEPYGHLTLPNGKGMGHSQLANLCKIPPAQCKKLIEELEENGVFSRTPDGVIYSRRMVRDEALREHRAEVGRANGAKGGEHGAKGAEHGAKGGRPAGKNPPTEPPKKPPQNPLPSSSSASSSSPSGIEDQGADAPLPPASPTPVPPPQLQLVPPAATPAPSEPPAVMPPCPVKQLVAMFAMQVPELPSPRYELWKDSAGAEAMRHRWKWLLGPDAVREDGTRYATTAAEAIDWFGRFFAAVSSSDFLSGRDGAWSNCDLAWLMKRENFMKVVQGNYDNDKRTRRVR